MQYFTRLELTRIFPISEKAVRNWIAAAQAGKLNLTLHEQRGKQYIANTARNMALIQELVEDRRKYASLATRKRVSPSKRFYDLYSRAQILDIILNLDMHRELPLQYNYFDTGAQYWDEYANRLVNEDIPNLLNLTVSLLDINSRYLDTITAGYTHINVVDLGPGNGLAVKNLLTHLQKQKRLKRYIAIDISKEMLKSAKSNIRKWFGDKVAFEGHVRDFSLDRFGDILATENFGPEGEKTLNLVLLFGGTLNNLRSPNDALKTIYSSMGRHDLFLLTLKTDTEASRRYFDFNPNSKTIPLSPLFQVLIKLLGIKDEYYEVAADFDQEVKMRYIRIRLKHGLTIEFELDGLSRALHFEKGEELLVWRSWHHSMEGIASRLSENGFHLVHANQVLDNGSVLVIAGLQGAKQ
ncbi:MAG TPA: L-histidine N(alpha)-methyltransferase [Candidatus Saccharimonadales bacterium]|nr:L-histidine N(alpha)-methyltransferase [Candidatus Saccharimonadales bacterium]